MKPVRSTSLKLDLQLQEKEIRDNISALNITLDSLKTEQKQKIESIADISSRRIKFIEEISLLEEKKVLLQKDVLDLKGEEKTVQSRIKELIKESSQKKSEIDQDIDEHHQVLSLLENDISLAKQEREKVIADLDELRGNIIREEKNLDSLKRASLSLDLEIQDRQRDIFNKELELNKSISDLKVIARRVQKEYALLGRPPMDISIDLVKTYPKRRSELTTI
jgi:chromosome segregation ATPase